jgi:hypothetical protein
MRVADIHSRSLATSTAISQHFYPDLIPPLDVITVLNGAEVRFVLIGTHALGGWIGKPRCRKDVDLVIGSQQHQKAVRGLCAAYPRLCMEKLPTLTHLRLGETAKTAIQLFPGEQVRLRLGHRYTHEVRADGQAYLIPCLEAAIAMTFTTMTNPTRELTDRYLDAHDFLCMVKGSSQVDFAKLAEVGDAFRDGDGEKIVGEVRRVQEGEKFQLRDYQEY